MSFRQPRRQLCVVGLRLARRLLWGPGANLVLRCVGKLRAELEGVIASLLLGQVTVHLSHMGTWWGPVDY